MRSGKSGNDGIGEFNPSFDGVEFDVGSLEAREEKVRTRFWEKFRRVAAHIPFTDDLLSSYYCAMDPDTPTRVRGVLLGALAYFILPIDAIPDFVIGFGYTDDGGDPGRCHVARRRPYPPQAPRGRGENPRQGGSRRGRGAVS